MRIPSWQPLGPARNLPETTSNVAIMLPRTLEPEVMDTPAAARDYDGMDHSAVNRVFVDDLLAAIGDPAGLEVLDVGTGTAQMAVELGQRQAGCRIVAVDLATEMLKLARENVTSARLGLVVEVELVDAKAMPYEAGRFDVVMSNSIVHHIPEPIDAISEMVRVTVSGGLLFLRDLLRPADRATVEHLVKTYAGDENQHAQQMFRESFHAALSLEELQALLDKLGLPVHWARQTTDRHWTVCGCLA